MSRRFRILRAAFWLAALALCLWFWWSVLSALAGWLL